MQKSPSSVWLLLELTPPPPKKETVVLAMTKVTGVNFLKFRPAKIS